MPYTQISFGGCIIGEGGGRGGCLHYRAQADYQLRQLKEVHLEKIQDKWEPQNSARGSDDKRQCDEGGGNPDVISRCCAFLLPEPGQKFANEASSPSVVSPGPIREGSDGNNSLHGV